MRLLCKRRYVVFSRTETILLVFLTYFFFFSFILVFVFLLLLCLVLNSTRSINVRYIEITLQYLRVLYLYKVSSYFV
jgi:hypothetical protein